MTPVMKILTLTLLSAIEVSNLMYFQVNSVTDTLLSLSLSLSLLQDVQLQHLLTMPLGQSRMTLSPSQMEIIKVLSITIICLLLHQVHHHHKHIVSSHLLIFTRLLIPVSSHTSHQKLVSSRRIVKQSMNHLQVMKKVHILPAPSQLINTCLSLII